MEKTLVIAFSGGRTSAFMAKYLLSNPLYDDYKKIVVFANTSKERSETLDFVNECDKRWNLNVVWLEAKVNSDKGKGTTHEVIDYETASRNGEVFESVIKKYGIPNSYFKHCTRELKMRPIASYLKSIGVGEHIRAVGIRWDEPKRPTNQPNTIYPLKNEIRATKEFIRKWWDMQDFDLELKDYEGNCDLCYKKSERKKCTIINENPNIANWWVEMESKYSHINKYPSFDREDEPMYFHRNNESTLTMIEKAKSLPKEKYATDSHKSNNEVSDLDIEFSCLCASS